MAADQVKSYMKQLKDIITELDTIKDRRKRLDDRRKELETKINICLKKLDQPAVKYENLIVYAKEKTVKSKLKSAEKKQSVHEALVNIGINDPDQVLKTIADASQGEEVVKNSIKIQKI